MCVHEGSCECLYICIDSCMKCLPLDVALSSPRSAPEFSSSDLLVMFCPSKNPQPIPALSQRYSVIEPPSCHFQSCNIYFAPLVAKRVRCKGKSYKVVALVTKG